MYLCSLYPSVAVFVEYLVVTIHKPDEFDKPILTCSFQLPLPTEAACYPHQKTVDFEQLHS